jgi:hypothetical protein
MRHARVKFAFVTFLLFVGASMGQFQAARAAVPGETLWAKRFNADTAEAGVALATGPDGTKVFVTGYSGEYATTVAYDAVTGAKVWDVRDIGPAGFGAAFRSIAVSADGGAVFVAGFASGATSGSDYYTVAYDSSTGMQLWRKTYQGPGNFDSADDYARAIAITTGGVVLVTGSSSSPTAFDYATLAYDASTGSRLWIKRFDGPASGDDLVSDLSASYDGARVFVTGWSLAATVDYTTIAYSVATGARLWVKRFDGPGHFDDTAYAVAVAPDDSAVFVTGTSGTSTADFGTVAYAASSGTKLWAKFYDDPTNGNDGGSALGTSPDGATLYVTGGTEEGFATVAYDAATGVRTWVARVDNAGSVADLAIAPNGSKVALTGGNSPLAGGRDYLTIGYASTGAKLWSRRYDGPGHDQDNALSIAFGPGSSRVFVTGMSRGLAGDDIATVAYAA